MNAVQQTRLRDNRVGIVQDLEPRGDVLDKLVEDGVLSENDSELVSSAKSRKERCQLLLSMLPTRGPSAYGSFCKALTNGQYHFLAEKLDLSSVEQISPGRKLDQADDNCTCKSFINELQTECCEVNRKLCAVLKEHCCIFLNNIEPRDIIDQLCQDDIISADDIDNIMSRATRRQRCETLFNVLLANPSQNVFLSLKVSLKNKYGFIVEALDGERSLQVLQKHRKDCYNETGEIQMLQKGRKKIEIVDHQLLQKQRIQLEKSNQKSTKGVRKSNQRRQQLIDSSDSEQDDTPIKHVDHKHSVGSELQQDVSDHDQESLTFQKRAFEDESEETLVKQHVLSCDNLDVDVVDAGIALGQHLHDKAEALAQQNSNKSTHRHSSRSENDDQNIQRRKQKNKTAQTKNDIQHNIKAKQPDNAVVLHKHENALQQTPSISFEDVNIGSNVNREMVHKTVTCIQAEKPRKRLAVAFNYLSTLINQGDYVKFENTSSKLKLRFPKDHDLMCILGYLNASRDLFRTDFDSAKRHIKSTMAVVPKTSNPRYFMLELFTAKTRMYITQKKLEKLQTTLDDAMMILETDPVGCTGRAAGWLYINHARNKTAQLSCMNLSKPGAFQTYNKLFESAKTSFQRSMTNFKKDGGKDGPFGFGYALCRLVILLLRCGDNGQTMGVIVPPEDDVTSAGQYIRHLEDSDVPIPKILDMHFRLAKCDYYFRLKNYVRALEHADVAFGLATELNMLEFTEHAQNRLSFLRSKFNVAADDHDIIEEEEAEKVLFEESGESDTNVQSE